MVETIKKSVMLALSLCLALGLGFYAWHLKDSNAELLQYRQEHDNRLGAEKANKNFIVAFFQYNNTGDRYSNIKKYMTEKGYKSTFPSGVSLPTSVPITSTLENLSSSSKEEKEGNYTLISEFDVTTTFNRQQIKQNILLKTDVIKSDGAWQVNNVVILLNTPD